MPIYEYVCTQCGRRIEVIHGLHAEGPAQCQHCAGAMRKALSPPAIVFKGSGWAKVDARASTSKSPAGSSSASDTESPPSSADGGADKSGTDSAKSSGTKTDAKSAATD